MTTEDDEVDGGAGTDADEVDDAAPEPEVTAADDTALDDTALDDTALDDTEAEVAEELEADDVVVEARPMDDEPAAAAPAPMSRREARAELKASARRVRRVVRRIDPWSVFKVASIFIAAVWAIVVLASLLIWRVAVSSGSVDNTEDFIKDLGFEDFSFDPQQMFESLLSAGAVVAIALVFFVVLLTVLFNLVCDITGGLRITMIEQDQESRPSA